MNDIDPLQDLPNPGTWGFDTIQHMKFMFAGYRHEAAGNRESTDINDFYLVAFNLGRQLARDDTQHRLARSELEHNPDRPKTIDWGT